MSTLKDQLIKLGFNPTEEAAEPAWGQGRGGGGRGASHDRGDRGGRGDRGARERRGQGKGRKTERKPEPSAPRFEIPVEPEERARAIKALLKKSRLPLPASGPKRFYYQQGEQIDYLEVDHEGFERLVKGQLGLTTDDSGRLIALRPEALRELEALRAAG